jgi:hypothetical protein
MGNILSSKTLSKQPQVHVKRRREEREKNEREEGLTVLALESPLCAMLPTRNPSPTLAMAPKILGLMREWRKVGQKGENGGNGRD